MIEPYGFCIFSGVIISYLLTFYIFKKVGIKIPIDSNFFIDSFNQIIITSILGGRIFFLIFDFGFNFKNFIDYINIFNGGFSLLGSLTFIILWIIYKIRKSNFKDSYKYSYIAILSLLVNSFGRLGCYFAKCCGGKIFNIPLQIFSSLWYLFFFIFGIYLFNKNKIKNFEGIFYFIFVILFERLFFDQFRFDKIFIFKIFNLTFYKYSFLSFILIIINFFIFYLLKKKVIAED